MSVRDNDIRHLTDAEQDTFIKSVAEDLTGQLRRMVMDQRPLRDLAFWVVGPVDDPLQGIIHVHHLAGSFDLDTLPVESDAYKTHLGPTAAPNLPLPN